MVLLWFILGILLIFAIARYNESNMLFWTLLFSLIIGFAGAKMMLDINHGNEQKSNISNVQANPTQVPTTPLSAILYCATEELVESNNVVTAQKPVGQGIMPAANETDVILSEIFGRTRDQPQIKKFFNTS